MAAYLYAPLSAALAADLAGGAYASRNIHGGRRTRGRYGVTPPHLYWAWTTRLTTTTAAVAANLHGDVQAHVTILPRL